MRPVRTLYMILGALAYRFDKILHFAAHSRLVQNDIRVATPRAIGSAYFVTMGFNPWANGEKG
jgi:hypothetical protein